jgi:hypothetical protein
MSVYYPQTSSFHTQAIQAAKPLLQSDAGTALLVLFSKSGFFGNLGFCGRENRYSRSVVDRTNPDSNDKNKGFS